MAAPGRYKLKDNPQLVWAWSNMKRRCDNPTGKNSCYKDISYTEKWNSFDGFCDDMASTWEKGLSIDRIDPNKDYSKDNCRWATTTEQANNKRNSRFITINNVTKTLGEWIKYSKVPESTIKQRYYGLGLDILSALNTPTRKWSKR